MPLLPYRLLLTCGLLLALAAGAGQSHGPARAARAVGGGPFGPRPDGTIVAQLDFAPNPNGFSFANYGNTNHDSSDDLDAGDLVRLFGAEQVCQAGDDAESCVLTAAARQWLDQQIAGMGGGHCEGMAVTSLRFLFGNSYLGRTAPGDFQDGAGQVFDLQQDALVENYIAHYFVTQYLAEVSDPTREIRTTKTPAEILDLLVAGMQNGDPYTLGIYKALGGGRLAEGHAITPFAVEELDDGTTHVHVYDNNYPGETRYVVFDRSANTWFYETTTVPGQPVNRYEGDATTQNLDLTASSLRELATYTCPFCETTPDNSFDDEMEFSFDGEGEILISDSEDQEVGYDPEEDAFVDEIPDAEWYDSRGGLGLDIPPTYRLPADEPEPYIITIFGEDLTGETDGDLTVSGPGFVAVFMGLRLDPGEALAMTVSPDGRQMRFTASQDTETPAILLAIDPEGDGASYIFLIGGVALINGAVVTLTLDTASGLLLFEDSDGNTDSYDLELLRINADGSEDAYTQDDVEMASTTRGAMQFGAWQGGSAAMPFLFDEDGDGFSDEEPVLLDNEAVTIYLPLIRR